jgi:hypothetical protein
MLGTVLVALGTFLAFLDLVLRRNPNQSVVWLLHAGVILIGIGVMIGATGFVKL